jgi:hypothetical protein
VEQSPVERVAQQITQWWPILVLLTLLVAGLLASRVVSRAIRAPQEQNGVSTDVRAVAGAISSVELKVMQSRVDHSLPTCVVRIEPHADNGTQILEEVHQ